MQIPIRFSLIYLRIALAAGFLSAVASRLSLWGIHSSGWKNFVTYTASVNSFLPSSWAPAIAVISTILETVLALMLLTGFQLRRAAFAAGVLTSLFAIAMTISSGIKEPLDYSVFGFSAGSFLLAEVTTTR